VQKKKTNQVAKIKNYTNSFSFKNKLSQIKFLYNTGQNFFGFNSLRKVIFGGRFAPKVLLVSSNISTENFTVKC